MDFLLLVLEVLGHEPDFRGCSHTCTFGSTWAEERTLDCKGQAGHQRALSLHPLLVWGGKV